jgi:hypothetical protein
MEPELARKNVKLGIVLFVLVLVLFGGSILIAEIWNAVY